MGKGPESWDCSSKIFLSCGLNSLHFSPKTAFDRYPVHSEYHPNALLWLQWALPTSTPPWTPQLLFQVHERRFFHSNKPSRLLPPRPCICWPFHKEPSLQTSCQSFYPAEPPHMPCPFQANRWDPHSVIIPQNTTFFSFIALTTASNHNPLMSLFNMFLFLPWQQSLIPPPVSSTPSTGPDA